MDQIDVLRKLGRDDIVREGHFVYSSGRHGALYVEKATLYVDTRVISRLCEQMVAQFCLEVETRRVRTRFSRQACDEITVVGPEKGGIILSQRFADHLMLRWPETKVDSVFAEKDGHGGFVLARGYDQYVAGGRSVVVVEDVLTTGATGRKVVDLVRRNGAGAVALCALVNRGGVTADKVGDPSVFLTHTEVRIPDFAADECPLCIEGKIPVDPIGKGKAFLAARAVRNA